MLHAVSSDSRRVSFDNRPRTHFKEKSKIWIIRYRMIAIFLYKRPIHWGWWRDVIQDRILLNRGADHNISLNESPRGKKEEEEEVRQQARYMVEEEREGVRDVCGFPRLVGYCTNRCDHSIKTFSRAEEILFYFPISFVFLFYFLQIAMDEKLSWNSRGTENRAANHQSSHGLSPSHPIVSPLPHDNKLVFSLADGLRNLFFYQTGHYKINSSPSATA